MNPKRSASTAAPADPCCLVIFGALGDLAHRLLVPALYNLAAGGLLPEAFSIIGVARSEMHSAPTWRKACAALGPARSKMMSRIDCSTVSVTSMAMLTIRRRTKSLIEYSRGSNRHVT